MDAVAIVRVALTVLSDRLLSVLSLLIAGGLTSWVMWGPDWQRVSALGIFVVFAYLLVRNKGKVREVPQEDA